MIKLALCDSNHYDRNIIMQDVRELEKKSNIMFDIVTFEDGTELCKSVLSKHYDIIILDILLGGAVDGIETARQIRAMGVDCNIIFISACDEKLRELFHVGPSAFLDKPLQYREFENVILSICHRIHEGMYGSFCYRRGGHLNTVPLKDIEYFESNRNHVVIHTVHGEIDFTQSLSCVWEEVKQYDIFVKPGKSYIVNLRYYSIYKNQIVLNENENEKLVSIGRSFKKDTMIRYESYRRKHSAALSMNQPAHFCQC